MKCWWIFFHEWTKWGEPYTTTVSNGFGLKVNIAVQTRTCTKCNKISWREC